MITGPTTKLKHKNKSQIREELSDEEVIIENSDEYQNENVDEFNVL